MALKSSLKNMSLCLLIICFVCSSLLAGIYALTKDPIDAAAKQKTEKAIKTVLPEFTESKEASLNFSGKDFKYYEAKNAEGLVGYAIETSSVGFGGPIKLMVGILSDGTIYNTSVLSQSETPGLGANCAVHFAKVFGNHDFNPAARKLSVKKDGGDVDAITASTITSRAYLKAVQTAVDVFAELNK